MSTNKPELVILRGLQASGKTTWARQWVAEDRAHRVRVNKDDLRSMIDDGLYIGGVTEGRILAARDALVKTLMVKGLSVVVDDTNLASHHVKKLARLAHTAKWDWRVENFPIALDEAIHRDKGRANPVGEQVITDTYNKFIKGKQWPLPLPTEEQLGEAELGEADIYVPVAGPRAIIIDIDGTLALHGTRSPFDETRVNEDRPNGPVVEAVYADLMANDLFPVFVSGRTSGCRDATVKWIKDYIWDGPYMLYMRPIGDGRPDYIVKREIFDKHIRDNFMVKRVYDDRDQVVRMWRSLGLTVLQVADGAF